MAVEEILRQLAPGQAAILSQGRDHWRETRIERITTGGVYLSVQTGRGEGIISSVGDTHFHTIIEGGVVKLSGQVTRDGAPGVETGFTFIPRDEPPKITNRRETFRVPVYIKGKLKGTDKDNDENFDREWDITIKDISVGGLKGSVKSPPPHANTRAVLKLNPDAANKYPLMLSCRIIQSVSVKNTAGGEIVVRIAFEHDPRSESLLTRYVNTLQMATIKKGLR